MIGEARRFSDASSTTLSSWGHLRRTAWTGLHAKHPLEQQKALRATTHKTPRDAPDARLRADPSPLPQPALCGAAPSVHLYRAMLAPRTRGAGLATQRQPTTVTTPCSARATFYVSDKGVIPPPNRCGRSSFDAIALRCLGLRDDDLLCRGDKLHESDQGLVEPTAMLSNKLQYFE